MAPVLTEPARGTVRIRKDAGLGRVFVALAIVVGVVALGVIDDDPPPAPIIVQPGAGGDSVTVLFAEPHNLDPAKQGDTGSASVVSQLFESVTTFDPGLNVRPALAKSWDVLDGGRRIVFHLRPDGRFSDGTPITGDDVVRSWLRVIEPDDPSTLAGLFDDVEGVVEHRTGVNPDPASVGLTIRVQGALAFNSS